MSGEIKNWLRRFSASAGARFITNSVSITWAECASRAHALLTFRSVSSRICEPYAVDDCARRRRATYRATFAPGNRARVNDLHIGARISLFRFLVRQRHSPTYYGYVLLVRILLYAD